MNINKVSFVGLGVMGYPMAGFLKKNNFVFLKKHMNFSITLFSDLESGDYLFINNIYLEKNPI